MKENNDFKKFVLHFTVAGATGGIVKTITAPLDRIKLILQTQSASTHIVGNRKQYAGMIDCLVRIPKEQGFYSLWRGNGVNIARFFPTQAMNFSFNNFFRKHLAENTHVLSNFIAGAMAGICTTTVVYPLEFCQTRISADVGSDISKKTRSSDYVEREFRGLTHCLGKVLKLEGIQGLYRGYFIAALGVGIYRSFYFGLFENSKHLWAYNDNYKQRILMGLLIAQCVTITSGTMSYPFDTIGRRMMMEVGKSSKEKKFNTTWEAVKYLYSEQNGIKSFYKGISVNYLRGISGAMILVTYNEAISYLDLHY